MKNVIILFLVFAVMIGLTFIVADSRGFVRAEALYKPGADDCGKMVMSYNVNTKSGFQFLENVYWNPPQEVRDVVRDIYDCVGREVDEGINAYRKDGRIEHLELLRQMITGNEEEAIRQILRLRNKYPFPIIKD